MRNAYEIMTLLYLLAVVIYLFLTFMVYGVQGHDLMIQNSPKYFLSPVNMNYLTVLLYQLICGFIVTCFIGNIFLWISKYIEDVKTGYAIVMGLGVIDYGLRFVSSTGIFTLSPILAVQAENILLDGKNIMGISSLVFIPFIFLLMIIISSILIGKKRGFYIRGN